MLVTMAFGEGYSKPSVYSKTGPFKELQASYRWMCGPDIASVGVAAPLLLLIFIQTTSIAWFLPLTLLGPALLPMADHALHCALTICWTVPASLSSTRLV